MLFEIYDVFEEYHRGKWARARDRFSKRQIVALDTLYFKDPILDKNITDQVDAIKIIGLANLFEHNAYALQLAEYFYNIKILERKYYDIITEHINKNRQPILEYFILRCEALSSRILSCAFR
mgnify:CR=1 FL=1